MKPKKGKSSSKAANVEQNPLPQKNVEVVEENNEEEVDQTEVKTKPVFKKKAAKEKKVVKEPVEEEEDGVEDDETQSIEADDDEADVDEADDDEAADDEEADYDLEADNNGEADDDEGGISVDANPSLKSTGLEEPTTPSKVKSGPIPHNISVKKVIHVTKLPKKCTEDNIAETFEKYGPIQAIQMVNTLKGKVFANVAFDNRIAARKAVADNNQVKILDTLVSIDLKPKKVYDKKIFYERSIHVKNIKDGTTEQQLSDHFAKCGKVEKAKLIKEINVPQYAFIIFANKASIKNAMKLHNSVCNDSNLKLSYNHEKTDSRHYIEDYTVVLMNKQQLNSIPVEKLKSIFSKCGKIKDIDIICNEKNMAYITFNTKEAAAEAVKMDGQTELDVELKIKYYSATHKFTKIVILNLHPNCTKEDVKDYLSPAGEIKDVTLKHKYAIVTFNDSDGYCKSFLYSESFFKGQLVFIEPFSLHKEKIFVQAYNQKKKKADPNRPILPHLYMLSK